MTTQNEYKLRMLFQELKPGYVVTTSSLNKMGISKDLKKFGKVSKSA